LQLTFWEHATAATREALDLLLFAFVVWCLLEFRISQKQRWITRMALVYGMAVANNWAMIAFFPAALAALVWIKGTSFFDFRFIMRVAGWGVLGLSLYAVLPLLWVIKGADGTFWEILHANLAFQKAMLMDIPVLRSRVLLLSLTSILPLLIIGIRWPSSFGDTSVAGNILTNIMFKAIHIAFLAACIWVAFDQQFSPRALGLGIPFLTFYYLGALAIGYFTGYLLLVFGENRSQRAWRKHSPGAVLLNRAAVGAIWVMALVVPAGLAYKNLGTVLEQNRPWSGELAEALAAQLPEEGAVVMSDDPFSLMLLKGRLKKNGVDGKYILLDTRHLSNPLYHRTLMEKHGDGWPNLLVEELQDAILDDMQVLELITRLSRTQRVFYLHPSFGFFFERFYLRPHGLLYELKLFAANVVETPPPGEEVIQQMERFWAGNEEWLDRVERLAKGDFLDGLYIASFLSRAVNWWGVELQRQNMLPEAARFFQRAVALNPHNIPALVNANYNHTLQTGESRAKEIALILEDQFGVYRGNWEHVMRDNGPFDHPEYCELLAEVLRRQSLLRQASQQYRRIKELQPENLFARLALADIYLGGHLPEQAVEELSDARRLMDGALPVEAELEMARIEAAARFAKNELAESERLLLEARAKHPRNQQILHTLFAFYQESGRIPEAMETLDLLVQSTTNSPASLLKKANFHLGKGEFQPALESLDAILSRQPAHLQAAQLKTFAHIHQKEYEKALKLAERTLESHPQDPGTLLYQGVIFIEKEDYSKAVNALDQVLKANPRDTHALRNRALAHLRQGDLKKARQDYDLLRRIQPRFHVPYYGLGEIAYQQKRKDEAIRNYELFLRFVPRVEHQQLQVEIDRVTSRLDELKRR
jgi:tetratricopeptide (TPR) repeat protein